ncbi:hypothetical protein [Erythrobacter dokdonensis]|uniref:Uncharacterized protein n=2 Tax=Erythrobacter TaxID=1041 RepID=A0A1A7BMZ0_9SPHN|nr:hypothetical protein [Erythrobacter dokdonensis]OBV12530.1 hypothetical protein I603_0661 [Erythrobacter dokdonensis DSW-74]
MMGEKAMAPATATSVDTLLEQELARENRALAAVVPVLRHLLASEAQRLVSDAILARVRGMLSDLAAQLLALEAGLDPALRRAGAVDVAAHDALAETLAADPELLSLCHALATESHLAERLQQQHGMDPVLSPLLQELIASDRPQVAELAMNALAAQSRFIQSQRRMELGLCELPAELFHRMIAGCGPSEARAALQQAYDEAAGRIGLFARLVSAMRRGAVAALELEHAGLALFASALAALGGQLRAHAVIACQEHQSGRLALVLKAAGLEIEAIERQVLFVDPAARIPRDLVTISPERARLLLEAGAAE